MADGDYLWIEVDAKGTKAPAWSRSAALAPNGTVFVPAAICGEGNVVLCAGYDGVTIISYRNHAFVPGDWLAKEFPQAAEAVSKIGSSTFQMDLKRSPRGAAIR